MKTCNHCGGKLITKEEIKAGIHKECATEIFMDKIHDTLKEEEE